MLTTIISNEDDVKRFNKISSINTAAAICFMFESLDASNIDTDKIIIPFTRTVKYLKLNDSVKNITLNYEYNSVITIPVIEGKNINVIEISADGKTLESLNIDDIIIKIYKNIFTEKINKVIINDTEYKKDKIISIIRKDKLNKV